MIAVAAKSHAALLQPDAELLGLHVVAEEFAIDWATPAEDKRVDQGWPGGSTTATIRTRKRVSFMGDLAANVKVGQGMR